MLSLRHAKRIVSFILGLSLLLIGAAVTVLPGPETVLFPFGIALLATGFVWIRRWLERSTMPAAEGREKAPRRQGGMAAGEERR